MQWTWPALHTRAWACAGHRPAQTQRQVIYTSVPLWTGRQLKHGLMQPIQQEISQKIYTPCKRWSILPTHDTNIPPLNAKNNNQQRVQKRNRNRTKRNRIKEIKHKKHWTNSDKQLFMHIYYTNFLRAVTICFGVLGQSLDATIVIQSKTENTIIR